MRNLGHEAYSCDIQECSGGHPEWHILGDVLPLLNGNCRFQTMDGEWHEIDGRWDMIIAHPPCTYMSAAGACRMYPQKGKIDPIRYAKAMEAKQFFMAFYNADCKKIAIENPTPLKVVGLPEYTQAVQPNDYGEPYTKRTCFWLKGLPKLVPTNRVKAVGPYICGNSDIWKKQAANGVVYGKIRSAKQRSKSFQGISRAMAAQWAGPCYPEYVQRSIDRLKAFEPHEGYYVAFSGGKDSQCIYHLCELAGVKFDAHYSVTSVDPPELVRFIKSRYPSVSMEIPHDKDGKPITMWNLIPQKLMPPTRIARYCCSKMKECNGKGRVTVTGVRWAESVNRKANQGMAVVVSKSKRLRKTFEEAGAEFDVSQRGGIVMNDDNDANRRMVENCYRTHKTMVNPIVDWDEDQVWHFLRNVVKVESCSLYQEGYARLGCIGCPMAKKQGRMKEFVRWPKYKENYLKAFDRMLKERAERGIKTEWKNAEEVFDWWIETEVLPGQMRMDELMEVVEDENA